jgi:SAM-dependent methyltransferase
MERTVAADVLLQAQLARELAGRLCAPTGCAWYHGTWPTLRALGLVATPHRHAALFDRVLGAAAAAERTDALVCGAADAAMVEIVLAAYTSAGVVPRVTVLDRCATPVRVATDAAARAGVTVEPWVADVLDADRDGAFDVICTHGLLPLQPADVRPQVIARWAALLRPGGVVVTTSSLAGPDAADPSVYSVEAVEAFAERAASAFASGDPDVAAALPFESGSDVADAAREWASRAVVHPVRDAAELAAHFDAAGFDLDVDERTIEGPVGRSASGPWAARSTRYAELTATKR